MSKHDSSFLGQEVVYDEGSLSHFNASASGGAPGRPGGGGSGGTAPAPTLVTTSGSNLQFNLIWDSSITSLGTTNQAAFQSAMVNVAHYYESLFTAPQKEIINIKVGWGEINGQNLPSGALGTSSTNGYLTNYATVTNALSKQGFSFTASNEPTSAQFFISSAEAKSFGLISGTSTAIDGYVGFGTLSGTGYSWNFGSTGSTGQGSGATATTFSFQGVAQHELSEVLGRIEMEGHTLFNGRATYTPLDLFNFSSAGTLALSGGYNSGTQAVSYFSTDTGSTPLAYFNDGYKGGDIADWESYGSYSQSGSTTHDGTTLSSLGYQDSFDAFGYPGINTDLSYADQLAMETLGLGWWSGVWIA